MQLGDKGKLLEQGTEVEVLPSPSKRAPRQVRERELIISAYALFVMSTIRLLCFEGVTLYVYRWR